MTVREFIAKENNLMREAKDASKARIQEFLCAETEKVTGPMPHNSVYDIKTKVGKPYRLLILDSSFSHVAVGFSVTNHIRMTVMGFRVNANGHAGSFHQLTIDWDGSTQGTTCERSEDQYHRIDTEKSIQRLLNKSN
jgi:hypothetical protein